MGGVDAIRHVLRELPLGLPGIVITQHMPPIFTKKYAQRLDKECSIKVVEGKHGDVSFNWTCIYCTRWISNGNSKRK